MSKLYIVATPIGNLKDISKRALETLTNCDFIIAEDTRHTLKLLSHYNIQKKLFSYHEHNEQEKSEEVIKRMVENDIGVALVTDAGTPCISDPGYIVVKKARDMGIEIIGISGPSAVITALSVSGFQINTFAFYGFLPREQGARKKIYEYLKYSEEELFVLYESPKRIIKLLKELSEEFINSKVAVCSDLTKLHERTIVGEITEVLKLFENDEKAELGEYVVIIQKEKQEKVQEVLSNEAMIIDYIVKNKGATIKTAVTEITKSGISKKDLFNAGINLKETLHLYA